MESFLIQSNAIENIHTLPTLDEITAAIKFVILPRVGIDDLAGLIDVFAPGNQGRFNTGVHNVVIAGYHPMQSGPLVMHALDNLLNSMYYNYVEAFEGHLAYEMLHPFTDGNGRTGRLLWLWQHIGKRYYMEPRLGWLQHWYYDTLTYYRKERDRINKV